MAELLLLLQKRNAMKQIVIGIVLTLATIGGFAQSHSAGNLFATGGIGVGHYGYHTGPFRTSIGLPVILNIDYGIMDYVSVGGYFGALFKDNSSAVGFGGRGSFHFWQLLNDKVSGDLMGDTFDIYGSVYTGGEVSGYYHDRFRAGGILGARWFFHQNISCTVEFGGPMSIVMAGLSFELLN